MYELLINLKSGDEIYLNKNRLSHKIEVTFSPQKRKDHWVFRGVMDGECKDFVFTETSNNFISYSKEPKFKVKKQKVV